MLLIGVSWVDGSTAGGIRGMTATSCWPLGSRYWAPTTLAMSRVFAKELPSGFHWDHEALSVPPRPRRTIKAPTAAPRTIASSGIGDAEAEPVGLERPVRRRSDDQRRLGGARRYAIVGHASSFVRSTFGTSNLAASSICSSSFP